MNRATLFILVLASLACVFGWETYQAWTMPVLPADGPSPTEAFSLPSSAELPQGALGGNAGGALASVLERPVFRPDRRPYRPETSAAPMRRYEAELARFTVLGVLMMEDARKALVVGKGAGERWEVGAGDKLPGFTVKEITPDGLVLSADDREFTLPLYAGGPKATGGALRTEVSPPPAMTSQPQPAPRPGSPPQVQPAPTQPPARPPAYAPAAPPGGAPSGGGVGQAEYFRNRMRRTYRPATR